MSGRVDTAPGSELFEEILLCARYGELPELQQNLDLVESDLVSSVLRQQDARGNTPLHFCCANGHVDVAEKLVAMQCSGLNICNEGGNTALHWACLNGHLATAKILVAAGADVKLKNKGGRMPIDEAESQGKEAIVLWLLALDMQREKEAGVYDAEVGDAANEDGDVSVNMTAGDIVPDAAVANVVETAESDGSQGPIEEATTKIDAMDMLD